MSRELDCAVRTAKAALENLFQIAAYEREDVHIYFDDRSGLDLSSAVNIDGNSLYIVGWQSSSYSC